MPRRVIGSLISLATPLMVNGPVAISCPSPTTSTEVLLNVIRSCLSASKKSPDRRCPSRRSLPVLMLAIGIVTSTVLLAGFASS